MFKISSEQNLQNFFLAKRFINVNNQACFQKILQIYTMSETEFNMKEKKKKENPQVVYCLMLKYVVHSNIGGKDGTFKVTDLNADISAHFKTVKVHDSNGCINLKCLGYQSLVS